MRRVGARAPRTRLVALSLVFMQGCVAPAFNASQYEAKVAKTAEEAASALETASLALSDAVRHRLYHVPIEVSLSDAEDILGAIEGTFASVQPPGEAVDPLRQELLSLLDDAGSALEESRIAFRRGAKASALQALRDAKPVVDRLRSIAERY